MGLIKMKNCLQRLTGVGFEHGRCLSYRRLSWRAGLFEKAKSE